MSGSVGKDRCIDLDCLLNGISGEDFQSNSSQVVR